jgi:hypothetical protein
MKYNRSQTVNNPSEGKIPSACYKTQRKPPRTPGLRTHIWLLCNNVHTHPQGSELVSLRAILKFGLQSGLFLSGDYNIWCPEQALTFQWL